MNQTRVGPRERMAINGVQALSDAELIAILLGTGSQSEPAAVLAARVLEHAGGLNKLTHLGISALSNHVGIGIGKACRLQAAFELGKRAMDRPLFRGNRITCSRDVDAALRTRYARESCEHFIAVALDTKNRPLAEILIAKGGLCICAVKPADVFRAVLRESSEALILVHNHPSGEPTPSTEDISFTKRLRKAGKLIDVQVLDHIIIGEEGYFSFLDAGLLDDVQESSRG